MTEPAITPDLVAAHGLTADEYARVVLDNPKVRDGRVWLGMSQKAFRRHMSDS